MSKSIKAKVGTYQKDGATKGRYVDIGAVLSNANGEYILLDPTVNLAGVMLKQQAMSEKVLSNVMCSIFDNDRQQAPQQQPAQQSAPKADDFDSSEDDIPF